MQGAGRRPYIDMVKTGNAAAGALQRGAGALMFFRGTAPVGAHRHAVNRGALWPAPGSHLRVTAQALLLRPRAPGRSPDGTERWQHRPGHNPTGTGRSGRISLSGAL